MSFIEFSRDIPNLLEHGVLPESVRGALGATYVKSLLLADGVAVDSTIVLPTVKEGVPGLYQHTAEALTFRPPQEITLDDLRDGQNGLDGPFMVNIRARQDSPHRLTHTGDNFQLTVNGEKTVNVTVPEQPRFYDLPVENVKVSQVVQKLGADGLGLVPSNYCAYFSHGEQCRFCEIVPNYKTARVFPKARKPLGQMQEAIRTAVRVDPTLKYLFITTGNDPTYDETYEHYIDLLDPLKEELREKGVMTFGVLMPPDDFSLIEKVHEAGLDSVTYNLEVWDRELAGWMTPGKVGYGRDKMLASLDRAVEVFGEGYALTNLVYGIQSYEPGNPHWVFDSAKEREVLLPAIDQLLSRGVLPTHTVYHTSGVNPIGPIKLSGEELFRYHMEYAAHAYDSGVVPEHRAALFAGLATVSNSLFNDAYATMKLAVETLT